ncbi:mycobactin-specific salicyl-AMP ligase domain protein [Mycobacterium xenopi 3993]|nr:mycobactin-specific salicyl-AMP ligase domain protein [Mycobacterium xenopi 3993]
MALFGLLRAGAIPVMCLPGTAPPRSGTSPWSARPSIAHRRCRKRIRLPRDGALCCA